jgi:methionyl-tRNA formyltransferase
MSSLNVVFLGSPQFAVPSFEALVDASDIDVALVVTQPDRRAGRGRKLNPPAVKVAAEFHGIPVHQPESLHDEAQVEPIRGANPDVIVVVSYGEILRKSVLELPPLGCINVHPSLLPAYRGSIPIQAAILNGDNDTGVSFMKLVRRLDAGPVLHQVRTPLSAQETTGDLSERLSHLAADYLPETLRRWAKGEIKLEYQNDAQATYTRELTKADAQIDWAWPAPYIERFVRAMYPWPKAWTTVEGQRLVITSILLDDSSASIADSPGLVRVDSDHAMVATGNGKVRLHRVQPAGKREMSASDWVRGLQGANGLAFESPVADREPLIFRK